MRHGFGEGHAVAFVKACQCENVGGSVKSRECRFRELTGKPHSFLEPVLGKSPPDKCGGFRRPVQGTRDRGSPRKIAHLVQGVDEHAVAFARRQTSDTHDMKRLPGRSALSARPTKDARLGDGY